MEMYSKKNKVISSLLLMALATSSLTGCQSVVGTDVASYPLQSALTQQEVLDYYAKSLDYDTVVSRNAEAHINEYVTEDVEDEAKLKNVKAALDKTQKYLKQKEYTATEETSRYLSTSMYNYIRAMLNDKALINPNVVEVKSALGYYFVDVEYDIKAAPTGTFKDAVSLIGMNGAYVHSTYNNTDKVDQSFMQTALKKMNDYFKEINSSAKASFSGTKFSITGGISETPKEETTEPEVIETPQNTSQGDQGGPADITGATSETSATPETSGEGTTADITNSQGEPTNTAETNQSTSKPSTVSKNYKARTLGYDLNLFNKVVGYGTNRAYVPKLSLVYSVPDTQDSISGVGIFPCGNFGLRLFNLDRSKMAGTCKLRYLYKEDLNNPSKLTLENIYVKYYEITNGFSANYDNQIPEFLETEFNKLIDRADRAMVNNDLTGLMAGDIFSDIGTGVLRGYEENFGSLLRQISTVRRILSRDIENNAYLVEIETYRVEGDETADRYPSYKDTVYAVIEQLGSKFIITDWMIMNRQLMTEPDIDPDTSTAKRIVSLGLTGNISDNDKTAIEGLVNDLYTASTNRITKNVGEVGDPDYMRGMYDCFDSDVEMLSSSKKEEINSRLRNLLVKHGTKKSAEMSGQITEWIGGTDNQAEFITEEVITYQGRKDGVYMKCYYLVSKMTDKWVIDDLQILSQEELSDEALNNVVGRIRN